MSFFFGPKTTLATFGRKAAAQLVRPESAASSPIPGVSAELYAACSVLVERELPRRGQSASFSRMPTDAAYEAAVQYLTAFLAEGDARRQRVATTPVQFSSSPAAAPPEHQEEATMSSPFDPNTTLSRRDRDRQQEQQQRQKDLAKRIAAKPSWSGSPADAERLARWVDQQNRYGAAGR